MHRYFIYSINTHIETSCITMHQCITVSLHLSSCHQHQASSLLHTISNHYYISKVSQNFKVGCVLQFEVPDVRTDYGLLNSELDYTPIPGI